MTAISALDPTTLRLGSALHLRHRHPMFVMFRYAYLLLIPLGAILLYFGDRTFGTLCLMIGPLLFLRKIFWQFRLIQGAKKDNDPKKELHWTFTDEGFHQKSAAHEKDFQWQEITERHLSPRGLLLYLNKEQYFVLPKSAFRNQDEFEEVTRLVQEKVKAS